ncbi:MAG: 6-phosphogluconolactonase, partial [Actinobacteria bacterium]|nr:6-phosphogluconolactonase [Actinomycetota bacterium]
LTRQLELVILSIGPDGHIASLFPGHRLLRESAAAVVEITDSPKPPPQRVTWTLPLINCAKRVWLIAAGTEKDSMVQRVIAGDESIPASCVRGQEETVLYRCP